MENGVNDLVEIELVMSKPYCADSVSAFWPRKGHKQKVRARFMNDWDIRAGLNKGILKIVKEKPKDIPKEEKVEEPEKEEPKEGVEGDVSGDTRN